MIVFDLETTGLPKAEGSDLDIQPKIIEFGAIKIDDDEFKEVAGDILVDILENHPSEIGYGDD